MRDVSSHRLGRATRGVVAASAVIAAITLASSPATAAPDAPDSVSEALKQYKVLTTKTEKLQEKYHAATDDLNARKKDYAKAQRDMVKAAKEEKQAAKVESEFRDQVDELSDASLQGARFNKLSALLTGESKKDFLERASALDVIAADNNEALHKLSGAVNKAQDAQNLAKSAKQRASKAADSSRKLISDIREQNEVLDKKKAEVKEALAALSPEDSSALGDPGDQGTYIAPPGAAGIAMDAALSQRGKPYVWGATGPDSYDCSGLMMWSWQQAGITIPRSSSEQATVGTAVDRSELQPGDMVFFGSPVHHVGMYVGDGMMVNASTEGIPVRVEPIQSDYSGARRLSG